MPQVLTKASTYVTGTKFLVGTFEYGLGLEMVKSLDLFSWVQEGAPLEVRRSDLILACCVISLKPPYFSVPPFLQQSNEIDFPPRGPIRLETLSKKCMKVLRNLKSYSSK